jgi:hypothetical protein
LNDLAKLFDPYDRHARLFPAVLMLVPALLFVAVGYPRTMLGEFPKNTILLVMLCAIAYALSGFARSAGKSVERRLFDAWSGPPTTTMLRHRDTEIDDVTKARYRAALTQMCTGISLPDRAQEAADPTAADTTYASAVGVLRARRRGEDFALVLKENTLYGFRRNMYGLRTTAIVIALLTVGIAGGLLVAQLHSVPFGPGSPATILNDPRFALLTLANAVVALCWVLIVRPPWVYEAARNYASALFNTLDDVGGAQN